MAATNRSSITIKSMDQDERQKLETDLARYRELAREFTEGVSARNIQQAIEKLEREIRDLEK